MVDLTQSRHLSEAILDAGIENTNFFNGRLLAAGDLLTEQTANRQQHQQLGLGLGAGVVYGLEVALLADGSDGKPPVVSVTRGLAINPAGQAVSLGADVSVALTRSTTPQPTQAGLFADCRPPSGTVVPLDAGFYLLAAAPASGFRGSAPARGFTDTTAATGCGMASAVEGASFRLVVLDVARLGSLAQSTRDGIAALMKETAAAKISKLRNWLAHVCFGTEETAVFLADPFAACGPGAQVRGYGAIDALRASGDLTDRDVPLALMFWTVQGVRFLDMWSVRRRPVQRPASGVWPGRRQQAEAEAVLSQFEAQLGSMIGTMSASQAAAVRATDYFRYLPPLGVLPLSGFNASTGLDSIEFVKGVTARGPAVIEGALLEEMIAESFVHRPVDLATKTMIWLYAIRENLQAQANVVGARPPAALVFTTGYMPYRGNAQFDLSHWSFGNFAPVPKA